jgi:ribosomal protein S18 acetylase RimI-like enzyme
VVRDVKPGDQEPVRELILDGMRERWGDAYDPSVNRDLDDISASYLDRGAEVVVEIGGEIVATGTLQPDGDGRGRLVRMSVDRAHRRQGLGRRVVEELVERAFQRGMIEVVVLTDTLWTSALGFYRSCGFDEVGVPPEARRSAFCRVVRCGGRGRGELSTVRTQPRRELEDRRGPLRARPVN